MSLNASEAFCLKVCRSSFLSLWSYANPQGKELGDELCDILVVCEPDVIIISVKDCTLADSGNPEKDWERWWKKAVDGSAKQIYGAERCLRGRTCVTKADGTPGLPLPPDSDMRLHRVAVAFGGRGEAAHWSGNFGKGFVHVLDERTFWVLLRELDTIGDFTEYLTAKEAFLSQAKGVIAESETDLLAIFLHRGRKFPEDDFVRVEADRWPEFTTKPEYLAKKEADEISYMWDGLVETVSEHVLAGTLEFDSSLGDNELVLRHMARENRFSRRILGGAFDEVLQKSTTAAIARRCQSLSGVVYVFLAFPRSGSRQERREELMARCIVAKNQCLDAETVIGIATERYVKKAGFSIDLCYFSPGEWTDDDREAAGHLQHDCGYFRDPTPEHITEDEYPSG